MADLLNEAASGGTEEPRIGKDFCMVAICLPDDDMNFATVASSADSAGEAEKKRREQAAKELAEKEKARVNGTIVPTGTSEYLREKLEAEQALCLYDGDC